MKKEEFRNYLWKIINLSSTGRFSTKVSENWTINIDWWIPGRYNRTRIMLERTDEVYDVRVYTAELGNPNKSLSKVCDKMCDYLWSKLTVGDIEYIHFKK